MLFKSVTDWLTQWPWPTISRVAFATNNLDIKNGDNSSSWNWERLFTFFLSARSGINIVNSPSTFLLSVCTFLSTKCSRDLFLENNQIRWQCPGRHVGSGGSKQNILQVRGQNENSFSKCPSQGLPAEVRLLLQLLHIRDGKLGFRVTRPGQKWHYTFPHCRTFCLMLNTIRSKNSFCTQTSLGITTSICKYRVIYNQTQST